MKNSAKVILPLLLVLTIGLNIWQANVIRPLPPSAGTRINAEIEKKDLNKSTLRIATYNIHSGKGTDGIKNINRTATALKGFDVIALNEVRGKTVLSHSSQVEKLGEMLKMGWLFLPSQKRYLKESFGNGFLSSFPVSIWYKEPLIYEHDDNISSTYRNLTTIQLKFNKQIVTILVTHLDFNTTREIQLFYVINEFEKYNHCILIGDLNTKRGDPLLVDLLDKDNTLDAINVALGAKDISDRIDWIILKGFTVIGGGYTPPGVSDHPLYWVELEIAL